MIAAPVEVVSVVGPDATALLDSQCSQSLVDIAVGQGRESLLLEPDGRFGFWVLATREGQDSWSLLGPEGSCEPLIQRIRRFMLRERCSIEAQVRWLVVDRRGLDPESRVDDWIERIDLEQPEGSELASLAGIEALRIRMGRPGRGDVIPGDNPFVIGSDAVSRSASFSKGCYTGQELVARMDARSAAAPWRLIAVSADGPVEAGAPITVAGEVVGDLRSATSSLKGWCGIAAIKRSVLSSGAEGFECGGSSLLLEAPEGTG